ncbi:MAG: rhodanese-like domain-containing protein [Bacteroidia bacterium]
MKNLFLLTLMLSLFSCGSNTQKQSNQLEVTEFADKLKSAHVVLLDVRTVEEFESGFIAGAKQYDYYETASFEAAIAQLDKSKTYLIYCRSGGRSNNALSMMQRMGFEQLYELKGGMLAWRKADMPVAIP